ncbi:TRAP transporter fused permease subunit [Dichotomicrobium thermohalophilum]|uniref:TRAP transporter 4TM/12TM fusion protein n=1 Tax=Dichotomicrobium thermohalophilum TaxID=933063 RepID=A0A397PJU8_9HYPH|nr:TRAP transporter fused permease subunit [Dichotomicrobium thermohalophilum]RIA47535.1 TRAP transporter 4TM/12TM fusion protein [Dichotomicrobium thermohalophilum]
MSDDSGKPSPSAPAANDTDNMAEEMLRQDTGQVTMAGTWAWVFSGIALAWSLFQLWIASPLPFMLQFGLIDGVEARALHLTFALVLCFLAFGAVRKSGIRAPSWLDIGLAFAGGFTASYLYWNYDSLAQRAGILLEYDVYGLTIPVEVILGTVGILVLLEAIRRAIGLPLVIVAIVFLVYSLFGQSMPDLIAHRGLSLERLVGYQWLTGEGIFGIPIDVTTRFVFLFVLFGALLDRAGAGQYFIDLAFALVGRYRGGPAKASVLASGMTGMISGSSIANTVTTGTFTIPVMKRTGMPARKAGAIEVAASTDGQIMPPIMGAAAFVMAEFIGISYFDVVIHAFLPAILSYIGLFYIVHLEATKLKLRPLPAAEIPQAGRIFWRGAHFLLPIALLVYLLMVERMTTGTAIFYSTIFLMAVIVAQEVQRTVSGGSGLLSGIADGFWIVVAGLIQGAKNMISVAIAVAGAGIIVGAVGSTGLNNALIGVVEAIAGGNVYILLAMTAVLCLILGMGLPTTANYLVVASLMAPVLVELGSAAGLVLPLIAVHLFVFYFGLMADVTPPVGLAAYAASAISRADPIKTGVQAFIYSIRTAILPFIFIFNQTLIMVGIESIPYAIMIIAVSLIAMLCFTSITFRFMFVKLNWLEIIALALIVVALFRPGFFMDRIYPPYEPLTVQELSEGVKADQVRLHVTRETPYGDRFRLYVFQREGDAPLTWSALGMSVEQTEDGNIRVTDPGFMSRAENAGVEIGDIITRADRSVAGQPAKELMFIPALLLLALVVAWQRRRLRAQAHTGEAPAAASAE